MPKPKPHEESFGFYQCSLLLPLNSPLRDEVIGKVMPSKRLAKRSVALKACRLLHEKEEFDDEHLLPKVVDSVDFEDEDEDLVVTPPGSDKVSRQYPQDFHHCRPVAGHVSFLYAIDFESIEPCADEKMFFMPEVVDTQFGILSSKPIPSLSSFPMMTRSGKVEVHLQGCDAIVLEHEDLAKLESFHKFLFQEVIYLFKNQLDFDLDQSQIQCLIVPLKTGSKTVDFAFVDEMINAQKIDWNERPTFDNYHFDPSRFADGIVVPWYRPFGKLMPYYVDSLTYLTPLSPFPDCETKTYEWYYLSKYDLKVTNRKQRLVQVSLDLAHKNFLLSR